MLSLHAPVGDKWGAIPQFFEDGKRVCREPHFKVGVWWRWISSHGTWMGGRFDHSKLRMASSDIEMSLVRVFVVVVRRGWAWDEVNRCATRLYYYSELLVSFRHSSRVALRKQYRLGWLRWVQYICIANICSSEARYRVAIVLWWVDHSWVVSVHIFQDLFHVFPPLSFISLFIRWDDRDSSSTFSSALSSIIILFL